jgi:hypothetical protein
VEDVAAVLAAVMISAALYIRLTLILQLQQQGDFGGKVESGSKRAAFLRPMTCKKQRIIM